MVVHPSRGLLVPSGLLALLMSACAAPVWLSGPGAVALPDEQAAILTDASAFCVILEVGGDGDGSVMSRWGKSGYADHIRLTPGRYTIAYGCNYQHSAEVRRSDSVDLRPGCVYEIKSKKNYLSGKVKAWIEVRDTGEVVAGAK